MYMSNKLIHAKTIKSNKYYTQKTTDCIYKALYMYIYLYFELI